MKLLRILTIILCALFFSVGIIRLGVLLTALPYIKNLDDVDPTPTVIVPGAAITINNDPSLPLKDRLDTAIILYKTGKVSKILVSGDNREADYNEPEAMRRYAISLGVKDTDIIVDRFGLSTYDTCLRAKEVFGQNEVIFTTQAYHLSRAVFLCKNLDLDVTGVPSEQSRYRRAGYLFWNFREVFATVAAVYDIYVSGW